MEDVISRRRSYNRRWMAAKRLVNKRKQESMDMYRNTKPIDSYEDSSEEDERNQCLKQPDHSEDMLRQSKDEGKPTRASMEKGTPQSPIADESQILSTSSREKRRRVYIDDADDYSSEDDSYLYSRPRTSLPANLSKRHKWGHFMEREVSERRTSLPRDILVMDSDDKVYQRHVLMKLDRMIEIQERQLELMLQMNSMSAESNGRNFQGSCLDEEELIPNPLETVEELNELCDKLKDSEFRKKMAHFLCLLAAPDCGATIRRMLRKIGTHKLWSLYSLKGKKKKIALNQLPICSVIIKACQRSHPDTKVLVIEHAIMDTLRFSPMRHQSSCQKELKKEKEKLREAEILNSDTE